jgi:uncharacterized membrane protein
MLKNGILVYFSIIFGVLGAVFGENNGFSGAFLLFLQNFADMIVFYVLLIKSLNNFNV